MTDYVKVPVKLVSEMALKSFCPSCWWIKLRFRNRMPLSRFPGIFSTVDSLVKNMCHGWFDRHSAPPPWLKGLGDLNGYIEEPEPFEYLDEEHGIRLHGHTDDIFGHAKGTKITDYKMSKFKGDQDPLYRLYLFQLNYYAIIAEACGLGPVTDLSLTYLSPDVTDEVIGDDSLQIEAGFPMILRARVLEVPFVARKELLGCLKTARLLHDAQVRPAYTIGCKDCERFEALSNTLSATDTVSAKAFAAHASACDEGDFISTPVPETVFEFAKACGMVRGTPVQDGYCNATAMIQVGIADYAAAFPLLR